MEYIDGEDLASLLRRIGGLPSPKAVQIARQLCAGLADAGFGVIRPQGTYFVTIDVSSIGETDGLAFCRSLPERCGVVAVPSVAFYDHADVGRSLVRFTFCKQKDVLDEAVARLRTLAG